MACRVPDFDWTGPRPATVAVGKCDPHFSERRGKGAVDVTSLTVAAVGDASDLQQPCESAEEVPTAQERT